MYERSALTELQFDSDNYAKIGNLTTAGANDNGENPDYAVVAIK